MKIFISYYLSIFFVFHSCGYNKNNNFNQYSKDGIIYLTPKGLEIYDYKSEIYEIYPSFEDQLFSDFFVGDKFIFQIKYSDDKYIAEFSKRAVENQLETIELLYSNVTNFNYLHNRFPSSNSTSNIFTYNCYDTNHNQLIIIDCYLSIEGKNGLKYTITAKGGNIDEYSSLMNSIAYETISLNSK